MCIFYFSSLFFLDLHKAKYKHGSFSSASCHVHNAQKMMFSIKNFVGKCSQKYRAGLLIFAKYTLNKKLHIFEKLQMIYMKKLINLVKLQI